MNIWMSQHLFILFVTVFFLVSVKCSELFHEVCIFYAWFLGRIYHIISKHCWPCLANGITAHFSAYFLQQNLPFIIVFLTFKPLAQFLFFTGRWEFTSKFYLLSTLLNSRVNIHWSFLFVAKIFLIYSYISFADVVLSLMLKVESAIRL